MEHLILGCLKGFRENKNKELYYIHFDWITRCLDAILDDNAEFMVYVNANREQMVHDTMYKEIVVVSPIQLEQIKVSYLRAGDDEPQLVTTILDQTTIDAIRIAILNFVPVGNIIKRREFENHLSHNHPEVKLDRKKKTIWDVVQKIGISINPMWRYKY